MSFSKRIKELRKEKGINQEELANKINKSESTVSSYELGRRTPDIETIRKLSKIFNVSVDYLVGESDLKRNPSPRIKQAIEDDPELLSFWEEIEKRESMKMMFKQTRNLSDEAIKDVVRFMKRVEDEAEQRHN